MDTTALQVRIGIAIEALLLIGIALVPLIIARERAMAGFTEMPKIAVLRTVAAALAILMSVEWTTAGRLGTGAASGWWRRGPVAWLFAAAGAVLTANLMSLALSPIPAVSLWGANPGQDGYALANVLSYLVIFLAAATHLRRTEQVQRLLWTITAVALAASA